MDEEYDNDYAENYFDNGEGDDMDEFGGGGGDDGGGKLTLKSNSCNHITSSDRRGLRLICG